MSTVELRRRIKRRIDHLSAERLQVAADFVASLEERESNEATEELLTIPGIVRAIKKAETDVRAGRLTPVNKLRRKH